MQDDRWQQYQRQKEAGDRRSRHSVEQAWSRWTGWGPMTFACLSVGLAIAVAVGGFVQYQRDAPLRRPDLPRVAASVVALDDSGKRRDPVVEYTAEGRQFTRTVRDAGHSPKVGSTIVVRYVPGQPQRIRPAGSGWEPAYPFLFLFAGILLLATAIVIPAGVLHTRRQVRQRAVRPAMAGTSPGAVTAPPPNRVHRWFTR